MADYISSNILLIFIDEATGWKEMKKECLPQRLGYEISTNKHNSSLYNSSNLLNYMIAINSLI